MRQWNISEILSGFCMHRLSSLQWWRWIWFISTSDIDYDIEIFQYDCGFYWRIDRTYSFSSSNELTDIYGLKLMRPDVEFYARKTKVISFTPQESGSYSFDVQYRIDG